MTDRAVTATPKPLDHNHLFVVPPRNTFRGEYICIGNGKQLNTRIVLLPQAPLTTIVLPEITPQPKIFIEYTLHVGANHPLAQWPDAFKSFRPLQGTHRASFAQWLRSRGISSDDPDEFFCWQLVIAPAESMFEVFYAVRHMTFEATAAGHYFSAAPGAIQQLLDKLPK